MVQKSHKNGHKIEKVFQTSHNNGHKIFLFYQKSHMFVKKVIKNKKHRTSFQKSRKNG